MGTENEEIIEETPGEEEAVDMAALVEEVGNGLFGPKEEEETSPEPKKEGEEAAATEQETPIDEGKQEEPSKEGEEPPVEETSTETSPASEAPKTWTTEAATAWKDIPPLAQAEILKREQDIFKGIESYKADAGVGKAIKTIMQPYESIMQQAGINPFQQVKQLMDSHYLLATGKPGEKLQFIHKLAKDYGIDLSQEPAYVPPEVAGLQDELNLLKSQLQSFETQGADAARASVRSEIETFAADPKNIYFDEVSQDIAQLIRSGVAKDLADAYEKAVRMNPVTYQKEQARLQKEQSDAKAAASRKKAEEVRKSKGAQVNSRSRPGSVTAPLGSIDDTLRETMAAIKARS